MKKHQEVICIDDKFQPFQAELIPNRPVEGKMYTIRDIFTTRNGLAVHLVELTNPNLEHPSGLGTFEPSFAAERFQPISEISVDTTVEEAIEAFI